MPSIKPKEVFFEFTTVGTTIRVVAVDAHTGTEVSLQVPHTLSQSDMQKIALRKLIYVMGKEEKKKK
jgi:hypothetical protein